MQKATRHAVVVKRVVHGVRRQHGRQRQGAARQALGQTNKVRPNARLLVGKHRAGAAESGGDFIDHQMHVVVVTQGADALQVMRIVHGHASGALHQGLDDQRGGAAVVLVQPAFERLCGAFCHVYGAVARLGLPRVGAGHSGSQPDQWGVGFAEQGNVGHGQRAHGFAVVATGHADKLAFLGAAHIAPVVRAHLQCDFSGGSAVTGVRRMAQAGQGCQLFRQRHHRLMGKTCQHDVVELAQLVYQRGADVRVAVAKQVDPPGADAVQVTLAVHAMQPHAFGPGNRNRRLRLVQLHLRAGVPHRFQAAGGQVVGRSGEGQGC